jgi:hypothetical protein
VERRKASIGGAMECLALYLSLPYRAVGLIEALGIPLVLGPVYLLVRTTNLRENFLRGR